MLMKSQLNEQEYILAIDTSGAVCSVCVVNEENGCYHLVEQNMHKGHDQWLFDFIEQALLQAGCTIVAVRRIIVVVGPGSFTGLRVGVAAAQGLSMACRIDTVGVHTFEAIYSLIGCTSDSDGKTCLIIPTATGFFDAQIYQKEQAWRKRLNLEEVTALLKEPGAACYFSCSDSALPSSVTVLPSSAYGAYLAYKREAFSFTLGLQYSC